MLYKVTICYHFESFPKEINYKVNLYAAQSGKSFRKLKVLCKKNHLSLLYMQSSRVFGKLIARIKCGDNF